MDFSSIQTLIVSIWVIVLLVAVCVAWRDNRAPADDIGVMFLLVLAIYSTLPPLSWLIQGGKYDSMGSGRLFLLQPEPQDVYELLWIVFAYAAGFASIYLWQCWRVPPPIFEYGGAAYVEDEVLTGAVLVLVVSVGVSILIKLSGSVANADSYIDQYRVINELPLVVRQLIKFSIGWGAVARFVVLVALLQRWPLYRGWFFVYILTILLSYDPSGSRVGTVVSLLAVLIGWHMLVRSIPAIRWFLMFSVGMAAFFLLGIYRDANNWDYVWQTIATEGLPLGELEAIWANAVELLKEKNNGLQMPLSIYFSEFYAFIPGQLLPFDKMLLDEWYVDTFYWDYKQSGGGWAFGAISQAVVGGGTTDAFIRGMVLAIVAAWLMRWLRSPNAKWWSLPLYLYVFSFTYQLLRNTTFYLLGETLQIVLPALIIIHVLSKFFKQKKQAPDLTQSS